MESELLPNLHETFLPEEEEADDAAVANVCLKEVGSATCFFRSFNQVRARLFNVFFCNSQHWVVFFSFFKKKIGRVCDGSCDTTARPRSFQVRILTMCVHLTAP